MFNITNIQSTARHQSISNEASTEVPLKEEIWNKISAFFSSEHQVEAQNCIAYLCHPPETASPEEIKSKFECLRMLAFPAYADNIQYSRGGADQYCILNENSQEILSIIFNTDGYTVEGGGKSVTYTRVTESEQASSASGSKDAVNYELNWSEWVKAAPAEEAANREKAVQRMRDCLKNNKTELRLKILGLTTIPACIPEQITTLILDNNELKSLPENLQGNIQGNIQILYARSNQLTSIPATLPDTIQKMELSINRITELPERLPSALQSLDLFHNKISSLPENLPEELRYLSVYDNRIRTLPEHLPSGITHLNVQSNSLTALPETLPPGLKNLEAGENALTSLPASLPPELQFLDVSKNQITVLPETLPPTITTLDVSRNALSNLPENLPAALQIMQASRNRLVRLPESLPRFRGEGPRPTRIIVEHNPFSERTIQNMQRLMSSAGYQGPEVFFAMGDFSIVRVTRPLHQAVQGWLTNLEEEDVNQWRAFETEVNAAAFSMFLDRLSDTQNTRHPDFKEQVSAWLMRLADDSTLRETAFFIAMDATISCEDRVTLAYHQMQEATLVHDAERGAFDSHLAELIMAGREIFRLEQIESLAREKVKRLFFIDEVEVYLGFQNQLRESLSLTTMTQDMRFYNVSGITESDLDDAEIRIKIAENRDFHKWFALWGPWHKVLERIAPEEWREMMDKRAECIETDEYQSRVNAELEALRIADDSDAERAIGKKIMEEINQSLCTELMENILLKKEVSSLMSAYWR
ncbi:SPI-1 type III secretion system effector E3 ubiquitin transferase SlrP [Salmonella enterica subsp. enterica serovar Cerro]|uniref:RING-type E3 ubiquitin transferase n=2 Tax=Salmonella enterica TaxID=28901 RepID=A0A5Y3BFH2_SALER|nr:SPI-1 type III secretion system effector E3 ubiquitin transferase SlrP [Salmonella enterica]EAW1650699.1 type III secretion system effector E3 ubiquitin transferase SlrP [Salmonella enterica subsp. enterica]EDS4902580.1 SPI-1 type III secretion system effector E3 ubiquitin transferase SlrP [Salmonella enterica subsp. enterica serovar Mbandaka]EAO5847419.1 SPI-1 type III secretion system effector E3 ubiquitin transferase SlrP [Salmonella enterica subsp. enterica serovar Cerro]EAP2444825.1 typ